MCSWAGVTDILPPTVHKNKGMQHNTLGSGTAEFQKRDFWRHVVHVKMYEHTLNIERPSRAHAKQVTMQEEAQTTACLWRKNLHPHGQQCNVTYRKPGRDLPCWNPVVSHFFTLIILYREAENYSSWFFSQKQTQCESHFKWFCTRLVKSLTLTLISPSSVLSSSPRGF